jgi:hypothetical protein
MNCFHLILLSLEIMMSQRIKINKITNNLIDVFHGEQGWETWTRLQVRRKAGEIILHPTKGAHLSQQDAKEVTQYVSNLS